MVCGLGRRFDGAMHNTERDQWPDAELWSKKQRVACWIEGLQYARVANARSEGEVTGDYEGYRWNVSLTYSTW